MDQYNIFTLTKIMKDERGFTLPMLALFLWAFIPLLVLAVDGYILINARTQQQNIAEFAARSAVSAYVMRGNADNYQRCQTAVTNIALTLVNNTINGVDMSGFTFPTATCPQGNEITGDGTKMVIGTWDNDSKAFYPSDPGSLDAADAIQFEMETGAGNAIQVFFLSLLGIDIPPVLKVNATATLQETTGGLEVLYGPLPRNAPLLKRKLAKGVDY